jgi:ABC-type amino acid transport system permease subunit
MLELSGSLPRAATARFAAAASTSGAHTQPEAEVIEQDDTTWARRLRSAVLLTLLVAILGAVTAATLGVLVVGLTSLIDQALG